MATTHERAGVTAGNIDVGPAADLCDPQVTRAATSSVEFATPIAPDVAKPTKSQDFVNADKQMSGIWAVIDDPERLRFSESVGTLWT